MHFLLYKLTSNSSYKKFDCLPVQSGPGGLQAACRSRLILMRLRLRGAVSGNTAPAPTLKLIYQFLFIIEFDKII